MNSYDLKRLMHYLLSLVIFLVIITGLGISYYQTMSMLTLGILSKNLAFKLHNLLFPVFLVLLVIHLTLPTIIRKKKSINID